MTDFTELFSVKVKHPPITLDSIMPFGKYQGSSVDTILEVEPRYLVWLAEETDNEVASEVYLLACAACDV